VKKEKKTGQESDSFQNLVSGKIYPQEHLIFRPAYAMGSAQADYQELNRRMSAYKAFFLKGAWLTGLFGLFLLSTIALTLALIFMRESEAPKE
jgi:hypothetical protein